MPRVAVKRQTGSNSTAATDVKSAARALDILDLLSRFPDGLSLTDIGKHLDIPLSSLHGLTGTLVNKGYAVRIGPGLHYRLGPRLAQIALAYRSQVDLITLTDPVMIHIRDLTAETVSLSTLQGDTIVFIHKRPAEGRIQVVNPVGTRLPAHATGSGKVMLAHLSPSDIDKLYPSETLPQLTPNTLTTRQALKDALQEACDKGYAYDAEESDPDIWAVAGCILDEEGRPVAAISVAAPFFRIQDKDYRHWYRYVRDGAAEVSALLGYRSA